MQIAAITLQPSTRHPRGTPTHVGFLPFLGFLSLEHFPLYPADQQGGWVRHPAGELTKGSDPNPALNLQRSAQSLRS